MKEIRPINKSYLRDIEIKIMNWFANFVPRFIGTKILTMFTLVSSILIFLSYLISRKVSFFLFFASFFIITQWIFDCLDGTIGRQRKEGFVRWGYYMDHFFDFIFMSSIIIGIYFVFPIIKNQILFLFFISSCFMVSFYLMHDSIKDKDVNFKISLFGWSPIEFRLFFIIFNTLLYFFKETVTRLFTGYINYINIILVVFLIINVYRNQKKLGDYDISEKHS